MTDIPLITKHAIATEPPNSYEIALGELVIQYNPETLETNLYTKLLDGRVVQLNTAIKHFSQLEDVDLTNIEEGSFFVREGDKFVASNFIGSLNNLSDVELRDPILTGQYLRWHSDYGSFINTIPSYNLFELEDFELPNGYTLPLDQNADDHVVVYDHELGKFTLSQRRNELKELLDVDYTNPPINKQILGYIEATDKWTPIDPALALDPNPTLANHLNYNGYDALASTYKVQTVLANQSTVTINYALGDYVVVNGVATEVCASSVLTFEYTLQPNRLINYILEIRQDTGEILFGGLDNVRYEDGRNIKLSGPGKVDLISVLIYEENEITYTYLTPIALNIATEGQGGLPAYRYDKDRYPDVQTFATAKWYDDYFRYVCLLLNFEASQVRNRAWNKDKSTIEQPVIITAIQEPETTYTFGLQDYVAKFPTISNSITISDTNTIVLNADFTIEFAIKYELDSYYRNISSTTHEYIASLSDNLIISYAGSVNTADTTELEIKVGSATQYVTNAYRYFAYQNNRYIHIALVRQNTNVYLFIDGVKVDFTLVDNPITTLAFPQGFIINIQGKLSVFRITKYARYTQNFVIPDLRFGLVGGAEGILDKQIFATDSFRPKLAHQIFL